MTDFETPTIDQTRALNAWLATGGYRNLEEWAVDSGYTQDVGGEGDAAVHTGDWYDEHGTPVDLEVEAVHAMNETAAKGIYRTVMLIEVYSRGPLDLTDRDDDPFELLAVNYEITDGDCIGDVHTVGEYLVDDADLVKHLVSIGNDGTFFDDEEE
jgi:hypothetical protein